MKLQLAWRNYRRKFVRPLQTAHGSWQERRGIILRLAAVSGKAVAYGEIAPIPGFGTETQDEAIAFLTKLSTQSLDLDLLAEALLAAPPHYSATRFGVGLAMAQLQGQFPTLAPSPAPEQICGLLPSGAAALEAWPSLWSQGHRTFKWKLAMGELDRELELLTALRRSLPDQAKLRLDANGGLGYDAARQYLGVCDALHRQGLAIEFLEQPLPPPQFDELLALSQRYTTPLALDESVTGLAQLQACYDRGWTGLFVIKGAIAGDPLAVMNFCRSHRLPVVFSSVFETGLPVGAVLAMAEAVYRAMPSKVEKQTEEETKDLDCSWRRQAEGPGSVVSSTFSDLHRRHALGFGIRHWLQADGLDGQCSSNDDLVLQGQTLWQQLSNG